MYFSFRCVFFAFIHFCFLEASLEVNLKNPSYSEGVLETSEGGVVYADGIRIQAQKIRYIKQEEVTQVFAEENILLEYQGQFFTGTKLDYDFINHTGTLLNGRTCEGIWFAGGEKIELKADGGFIIHQAFLTTCESQENTWSIQSTSISGSSDHKIEASHLQIRFLDIPLFALPSFRTSTGFEIGR